MTKLRTGAVASALIISAPALALETETTPMSFEACLATIRQVSSQLGAVPINIVETDILRVVRFVTSDGSVLVTCSQPDQKMIVTKSD